MDADYITNVLDRLDDTNDPASFDFLLDPQPANVAELDFTPSELPSGWPVMGKNAYIGLANEIVERILPNTEADKNALLLNLLTMFGNACNRHAYVVAGGKQRAQLYTLLVGPTGVGRKGTSLRHLHNLFTKLDPDWSDQRQIYGLGSGEALDTAFGDESDSRVLLIAEEFSRVLKAMNRDGATLSEVLRNAWDGVTIEFRTKSDGVKRLKDIHMGVIANVTPVELRKTLTPIDIANGFANRFLWCASRQSKVLPFGGEEPQYGTLLTDLDAALIKAKTHTARVSFDVEATNLWYSVYHNICTGLTSGTISDLMVRAGAYIPRIALTYALLDGEDRIRAPHLKAACSVWHYHLSTITYVYGLDSQAGCGTSESSARLFSPEQRILSRLRDEGPIGMTLDDIRDLRLKDPATGRTLTSDDRRALMARLVSQGLVIKEKERTDGRTATRYLYRDDAPITQCA